jgi:hypothetical protein
MSPLPNSPLSVEELNNRLGTYGLVTVDTITYAVPKDQYLLLEGIVYQTNPGAFVSIHTLSGNNLFIRINAISVLMLSTPEGRKEEASLQTLLELNTRYLLHKARSSEDDDAES